MNLVRRISGTIAIAGILLALNFLVLEKSAFVIQVLIPLGIGALATLVWSVTVIGGRARTGAAFSGRGLNSVFASIVFLGICIALYAFVRRWDTTWDLTREGRRELYTQTVQVLRGLNEDVEVTCFFVHALDARVDLAQDKTERFLARCQKYSSHLKVEFIDPQVDNRKLTALNLERISRVGTVVLKSGVRQKVLPLSDVTSRLEERAFTNALINVSRETSPKIYFLTGHRERDIANRDEKVGASVFKEQLEREAYQVGRHLIAYTNPMIPEDCAVLVVNGFQTDFQVHELRALDEYLDRGGRLLVLVNPWMVEEGSLPAVEQFRPWVQQRFGIILGNDLLASPVTDGFHIGFIPDFSILSEYAYAADAPSGFRGSFNATHPITRGFDAQLLLPWVRTVSLDPNMPEGVVGSVLLRSTPDTWAETDIQAVLNEEPTSQNPDEVGGPNSVAVAVTMHTDTPTGDGIRTRDARIVVIGDADLSLNEGLLQHGNLNLLLNSVAWLAEKEELIAIDRTREQDPPLYLSEAEERTVAWIASMGTVQLIAIAGALTYFYRRKFQ